LSKYNCNQALVFKKTQNQIGFSINVNRGLEVGIGQGIVSHILKFNGIDVTTADFDRSLFPDIICDVRNKIKCVLMLPIY
jgi:hypothetical protein